MNKNKSSETKPDQKHTIIHEFEASTYSKIVFSLTEFKGKWYINIRTWIRADPKQQAWGRTRRGIFITLDKYPYLSEGIQKLDEPISKLIKEIYEKYEKKKS